VRVTMDLTPDETARLLNRLRRVEGQARGLQRMIEEGRTCEDVFTQLSAIKAALDRIGILLISHKMRDCLLEEGAAPDSSEAIQRALETFLRYATAVRWEAGPGE
jgi:DNA-binding FrmR family transcriptional regulator